MIYCFHMKKYIIQLSATERERLHAVTRKGKYGARVIRRARVLLGSDAGVSDATIAAVEQVASSTVQRIRERYHDSGLDRALFDAPRPGTPRALDDQQEAHLVAIACSDPPEGHTHWTIELLKERMIADGITDRVAVGTIHARLAERGLKPWREKNVVHPRHHA
jgi:transposase